ncbi:hypothetical protein L226DRAFT_530855 [Lentinus tigrinus ALCF2SS1-7]|uniref:Uncharacterized protein n=1 Tax=Lentinus tigrinus ALCF2SS1-6 TaxID=1328759 RepID=A0A5C2SX79_9APHY|nr:hypothetical protein L227DRAFT_570897 [Lentinus tigrinus ALCF2SS1-6]RPD78989.1 hypothetical protein L226DRAFT_530855 [Lentinus tigrinus ALCF2SS1-7]
MQPEPPSTPVRGRNPSRYPAALSRGEPGRVPLHRRGTSRTLECLEDLLRENGYKETRVFTPEAERIEAMAEERRRQTSTWRIRELLTGWLPRAGGSQPVSDDEDTPGPQRTYRPTTPTPVSYHSTPSSPLSHKRPLDPSRTPHPLSSPNSASSTTLSSMRSSATSEGRTVSYQPSRREIHDRIPAIRAETSQASLRTYAQVSAAHRYLRHMASTPDMPRRAASSVRDPSMRQIASQHPLPASWLESVTRAVLKSGDDGVHIGGPIPPPSSRHSQRSPRASKENRFTFTDRTPKASRNSGRSISGLPPGATLYLSRPQTAPSAVNTAHVVCRSAPGSRSASRVGERFNGGGSLRGPSRKDRGRRGSRLTQTDRVPSLAATRVENDAWSGDTQWVDGKRVPVLHYQESSYEEAVDSDDDEDGELDLARLLVPPKRQYSIQSLRKHLHVAHTQTRTVSLNADSWEDEEGVTTRSRGPPVHIDDADGYPTFARTDSKRRRGLPGAWGNPGGGRS